MAQDHRERKSRLEVDFTKDLLEDQRKKGNPMGWQSSGQERKKRLVCSGPPKGWASFTRSETLMSLDHSHVPDQLLVRLPTNSEVRGLGFIPLLYCLIKNRENRYKFVDEVNSRITRDFTLDMLVDKLARDPLVQSAVRKISDKVARVRPLKDKGAPLLDSLDPLAPENILFTEEGSFKPLTKTWDGEFPAWAICRAIRATPWKGEDLGAYSARDTIVLVEEMRDREIVSAFDSDSQERLLKSIVSRFNNWARVHLRRSMLEDLSLRD
jgi:hypothetical protein